MGAYPRLEKVALESLEARQRAFLVALHHRGEADHVSGKDRGEAAGGHSGTPAFFIRQRTASFTARIGYRQMTRYMPPRVIEK